MTRVNYLLTGATGFTGQAVLDLLLRQGKSVRVLIRNPAHTQRFEENGIQVVLGDLNNEDAIRAAVQGVERVLHVAALFRQANLPDSEFRRVNVDGTKLLLDHAQKSGVDNFIYCSTNGVMQQIDKPPADETTPYGPGDPYQASKAEAEQLFLQYVARGALRGSVIRPAMVYGPGDDRFLKLFKPIANGTFFYVGRGDALTHFVDVRDLAHSMFLAAESDSVNGEVFLIAGELTQPLRTVANLVADLLGVRRPWLHLPVRPMQDLGSVCEFLCRPFGITPPLYRRRVDFFVKNRSFSIEKARKLLGYAPRRHLVQELLDCIDSYIAAGKIQTSKLHRPNVLLRTPEGKILAWHEGGNSTYGISSDDALQSEYKALLNPKFSTSESMVYDHLDRSKAWSGTVLHTLPDGKEIPVHSSWQLLPADAHSHTPVVLELNRDTRL